MVFRDYLKEIEVRKGLGLHAKPIDGEELLTEIISQILDSKSEHRVEALKFFIYNTLPGTTAAAYVKAKFLKEIIIGSVVVEEIGKSFAFEQLSHMKGGPSIAVLLDFALGEDILLAKDAAKILKTQVFLYEADTSRIEEAYKDGNEIAKDILNSYAKAEFFTKLPDIDEEIDVVTYIAGVGDISTDLLSPGGDAHSRSDRELHGQCLFEHNKDMQNELIALQEKHPNMRVMLIAEKGTMGVGSSRMSGVNNVALWTGIKASPYVPFINIAPVIAGTNGISPIFLTTVGVTGGIGLDLKNWVKQKDSEGNTIVDEDGNMSVSYNSSTMDYETASTDDKEVRDNEVNQESIEEHWKKFSDIIAVNGEKNMVALLQLDIPRLKNKVEIHYAVPNDTNRVELEKNSNELMGYLRDQLSNDALTLKLYLELNEKKKFIYTNEEKYKTLLEKNPNLEQFKKKFNLEF